MLNLYDTNNWARVEFEVDPTGLPLRRLFEKAFHSPTAVYFFDGPYAKQKRRTDFEGYKSGRKPAPDNFYVMLGAFRELLLHSGNVIVCVPGYEADDVIATFCKGNPMEEIVVHSTDRDFCALHRPGLTTPMARMKGVAPEDVRLHKTLVGDTGDSIPGVPGFGAKAFESLTIFQKATWITYLSQSDPYHFTWEQLGLVKPSHKTWLETNHQLIRTYWKIIGFYDVPAELIQQHTRVGIQNYQRANALLLEMFQ